MAQPYKLGGAGDNREREGQDKATGLPAVSDSGKEQRPAQREQQALIDQRTGIGVVDEQDRHHDHHHHDHNLSAPGPALGDDGGMGI